jgi:hypothetical protein
MFFFRSLEVESACFYGYRVMVAREQKYAKENKK